MSEYETRVTRLTVLPKHEPIFCERATHIEIEDEAAGEYVTIKQCNDATKNGEVTITPEEWPHIKAAIETMLKEIRL